MTPLSLAEHCQAYGIQGRQNILKAKQENFTNNMPESGAAYEVNNFLCDPHNRSENNDMPGEERAGLCCRMVSFTFECFLRGQEGRGTEMVYFTEDTGLIHSIKCYRHKV